MQIVLLKLEETGAFYLVPVGGADEGRVSRAIEIASSHKPGTYTYHGTSAKFSETGPPMPVAFFSRGSGEVRLVEDIHLHQLG